MAKNEVIKVDATRVADGFDIQLAKPALPKTWDYDVSVKKVAPLIYNWRNLTKGIAIELQIARSILSLKPALQPRQSDGTFVPTDKNWDGYCKDIGHSRQAVNRWLKAWEEGKAHVSHASGKSEWFTPPEYIAAARAVMSKIDVDPASTARANKAIGAAKFYNAKTNGLTKQWKGNVWMNPPYAQPLITEFCELFVEKYTSGEITQGCVLINNITETDCGQQLLDLCSAVCFPSHRIQFLDESGEAKGAPLQGQMIIYCGPNEKSFILEFAKFGVCL